MKLDDQFTDHPKVLEVGPLAECLFVRGLTYASRYLTDGFVPAAHLRRMGDLDAIEEARKLVRAGLWEEVEGGYQIHDYLDYQPSSGKVKAEREAARQRMQQSRSRESKLNHPIRSEELRPNFGRSSSSPSRIDPVYVPFGEENEILSADADDPEIDPHGDEAVSVPESAVPSNTEVLARGIPSPPSSAEPPASQAPERPIGTRKRTYPDVFERFWSAYPKTGGSKAKTYEVWRGLKLGDADLTALLAGITAWQASQRWQDGFVMEPARWLRERRWEEPPPPAMAVPARASPSSGADTFGQQLVSNVERARQLLNGRSSGRDERSMDAPAQIVEIRRRVTG